MDPLFIPVLIFVLGVLIFVHELGHFLVAKAVGIGVPRFSIGLGPATPLRFTRGETEYVIAWVPLGGYVKMASREEQEAMAALEGGALEDEFPPEKLFESKPLWARIATISAGVVMNALFAWVVYAGLAYAYGRVEDPTTTVSRVEVAALPEAAAGLAELPRGARIARIDGREMTSWNAIRNALTDPTTERVAIEVAGRGEPIVIDIPGTDVESRVAVANAIQPFWEPRIGALSPGSPAERAGIEPGDLLVAIDGEEVATWDDLQRLVQPRPEEPLTLTLERQGERLELSLVTTEATVQDLSGESRQVGQLGVQPQLDLKRVRYGLGESIVEGGRQTIETGGLILYVLRKMLTLDISPKELGGPILIGQVSVQAARAGFEYLLGLMAMLSINLAILNLLPIPVLDGGHLVFLLLEGLRGRPLSVEMRVRLTQVGVLIILAIMVFAIGNDLFRVLGWW